MKYTLLALALFATTAQAVDYSIPAGQCVALNVCATAGGSTPVIPTLPNCSSGQHLQGNVCVADPAPGPTGPISCPGFGRTILIDFPWDNPARQYSGSMGVNDVIVVRFTTGLKDSANNNLPRLAGAEWGSPPSGRQSTLSSSPCDFSPQLTLGATSSGNSVQMPFAVGNGSNFGYYPALGYNQTYFWNIKNVENQSCSAQGICDMFVELLKPSGL